MHFPDRRPDQTEERILPLINVVFLLLIFFMIAGSLSVTEPFEIDPPASRSQTDHEPDSLMILFGQNGQLALDNLPVNESELMAQVADRIKRQPDTQITLKADTHLPANQLVRFTQALYDAGVKKLSLLTLQEGE
jgi:biopolymer transport protein ExbD